LGVSGKIDIADLRPNGFALGTDPAENRQRRAREGFCLEQLFIEPEKLEMRSQQKCSNSQTPGTSMTSIVKDAPEYPGFSFQEQRNLSFLISL
jgi:hypothetical protein